MSYHGDIQIGETIQWLFTTVINTGAPTVLTGSPTATAYTDGGATQSATGVTLTADFDSVVGLNLMSVVATGANGFAAGENIEIVLDAGTVGGVTVVGYSVGSFSIENRSNLRPTVVGQNEVDVTATGAVGIDWANVENPTTALNLSGTNIDVDQIIASVSGNVADVTNLSNLPTIPTNWITAAGINAGAMDDKGNWNVGKSGYALTTADWNVGKTGYSLTTADWNVGKTGYTLTATTGLGAQTANITGNLSGSVGSVTGAVGSVAGNVDGSVASNVELGPTEVNAEMVDVLFTDTDAEPAKGLPGATISLADKIGFLYKAWRNRSTQTATVYSLYNDDAVTVDHDATVSDNATTADRGEMTDGP